MDSSNEWSGGTLIALGRPQASKTFRRSLAETGAVVPSANSGAIQRGSSSLLSPCVAT